MAFGDLIRPRGTSSTSSRNTRRKKRSREDVDDTRGGTGGGRDRRSTTTGGSGGGNTTVPPQASAPLQTPRTTFGKSFEGLGDMGMDVYANPELISNAWMRDNGMNPMRGGGIYKVINDMAAVLPDLLLLTQGGMTSGGANAITPQALVDFAGSFLNQMSGSAAGISPSIVGSLFNAPEDSTLGYWLNDPGASSGEQINRFLQLMGSGLQNSIPPQILSAVMNVASQQGTDFMTNQARGQRGGTFADAVRSGGIDDWLGI